MNFLQNRLFYRCAGSIILNMTVIFVSSEDLIVYLYIDKHPDKQRIAYKFQYMIFMI